LVGLDQLFRDQAVVAGPGHVDDRPMHHVTDDLDVTDRLELFQDLFEVIG